MTSTVYGFGKSIIFYHITSIRTGFCECGALELSSVIMSVSSLVQEDSITANNNITEYIFFIKQFYVIPSKFNDFLFPAAFN